MSFTLHPYDILFKIFGSKDVVRTRRDIYSAAEVCAQTSLNQVIPSGSRGEGLELEGSDFDMMGKWKGIRFYDPVDDRHTSDKELCLIMDTDDTKIGFTRLRVMPFIENCTMLMRQLYEDMLEQWVIEHGGLNYLSSSLVREIRFDDRKTIHGPCQMYKDDSCEVEHLFCFHCKEWISCAQPWTIRHRGGWPRNEVINDIKRLGVLFVPVGCKTSEYEYLEWRISFSIAEQQLIHSFNHVQFLCYAMLKTIVSDVVKRLHGDVLCSYFVKTVMFWISEEQDFDYWKEQDIVQCYLDCLKRLIYCVNYRCCLHFFIPELNFFEDRFTDNEQEELVKTLYDVYIRGWEGLLLTKTFTKFTDEYNRNAITTSSVVAPILWTSMALNKNYRTDWEVFNDVLKHFFRHQKTSILWMFIIYEYAWLTENRSLFYVDCNKKLYKHFKSVLPHVLFSTKFDCVTGWCYLATFYYQLKLYHKCRYIVKYCLDKCETDKIWLDFVPYISIPNDIQKLLVKKKYFSRIMHQHFITAFCSKSPLFLPTELADAFKNESFCSDDVIIAPTVYLFFLDFLCNHHLQDDRARLRSLANLQRAVLDRRFIVNDNLLINAEHIKDFAFDMKR